MLNVKSITTLLKVAYNPAYNNVSKFVTDKITFNFPIYKILQLRDEEMFSRFLKKPESPVKTTFSTSQL